MLTEPLLLGSTRHPTDGFDTPSILLLDLHSPSTSATTTALKRSHTTSGGLTRTRTHLFAAQTDKAVINIYTLAPSASLTTSVPLPEPFPLLSASPCGALLAAATASGRVYIWELATGRFVATPQTHLQAVTALAWSADGAHVVSAGADSAVLVWSAAALLDTRDAPRTPIHSLRHRAPVTALATGPGALLLSADTAGTVTAWDLHTGARLRDFLLTTPITSLALDPAGRAAYAGLADGAVQALDLLRPTGATGAANGLREEAYADVPIAVAAESRWAAYSAAPGAVCALAVSADGSLLVTGSDSGVVGVRDVATGGVWRPVLVDMKAPVSSVSLGGAFPVAASGEVRVGWEVKEPAKVRYEAVLAATSGSTWEPARYGVGASLVGRLDGDGDAEGGSFGVEADLDAVMKGAAAMRGGGGQLVGAARVAALEEELRGVYEAYERMADVQRRTWEAVVAQRT